MSITCVGVYVIIMHYVYTGLYYMYVLLCDCIIIHVQYSITRVHTCTHGRTYSKVINKCLHALVHMYRHELYVCASILYTWPQLRHADTSQHSM